MIRRSPTLGQKHPRVLQILPEIRAEQVERIRDTTDVGALYFSRNYDLHGTSVPSNAREVSFYKAIGIVLTCDASILEVPEPLWLREMPRSMTLAACFKISRKLLHRPCHVVTYAIENNDFATLLSPGRRLPPVTTKLAEWVIRTLCRVLVDRVAFGTPGARATYLRITPHRCETQLFLELPTARTDTEVTRRPSGHRAIFVGRIGERKGVPELMRAWPQVEAALPDASLTVVGTGPMSNRVKRWAEKRRTSRKVHIQVAHRDIYALLSQHTVLVAPSRPHGRWREQVGLPVTEALSLGLTVVTTDQTGLAEWLHREGHSIIPVDQLELHLADVLAARMSQPLPRPAVLDSLPSKSGRSEAQEWLHRGT